MPFHIKLPDFTTSIEIIVSFNPSLTDLNKSLDDLSFIVGCIIEGSRCIKVKLRSQRAEICTISLREQLHLPQLHSLSADISPCKPCSSHSGMKLLMPYILTRNEALNQFEMRQPACRASTPSFLLSYTINILITQTLF